MVREVVTIQVGQCGNQVGWRFWDLVLREHVQHNRAGLFDESLSSFFRNVDTRHADPLEIPLGAGQHPISALRARSVLVDTEEGVVGQLMRGPLADLFDSRQVLTDVSGAGNNWAHGSAVYGPQHREAFLECVRRAVGFCDSLQCFSLVHSMGGGTGSGLGTYLLSVLADEYPQIYRFTTAVFPSADDDVITSPYNAVLAAHALVEHADCVFPIDNAALIDLVDRVERPLPNQQQRVGALTENGSGAPRAGASAGARPVAPPQAFDAMNNLVAHMLANLTASVRFDGSLNTDLSDITSNLVPYPRLHFLVPALSPLFAVRDVRYRPARLEHMFSDAFASHSQLLRADPRRSRYLACGLLLRGDVAVSDVQRNLARVRAQVELAHWNPDGFKTGICSAQPVGQPYSLLALSNNCCMAGVLNEMRARFNKLYRRRAHVHHFTQYMEASHFDVAHDALRQVAAEYEQIQRATVPTEQQQLVERLTPQPAVNVAS